MRKLMRLALEDLQRFRLGFDAQQAARRRHLRLVTKTPAEEEGEEEEKEEEEEEKEVEEEEGGDNCVYALLQKGVSHSSIRPLVGLLVCQSHTKFYALCSLIQMAGYQVL